MIGTKISRCAIICNLGNRSGNELTSRYSALQLILHRSFRNFLLQILLCIIFSPCVNPQQVELQFENILVEGGMPVNVQSIFQDRTGFLWFATWSGLYKYDGYNFTCYKHNIEDSTSILDNTLSVVYEDKEGLLWIGSRLGLEGLILKLKHSFILHQIQQIQEIIKVIKSGRLMKIKMV